MSKFSKDLGKSLHPIQLSDQTPFPGVENRLRIFLGTGFLRLLGPFGSPVPGTDFV